MGILLLQVILSSHMIFLVTQMFKLAFVYAVTPLQKAFQGHLMNYRLNWCSILLSSVIVPLAVIIFSRRHALSETCYSNRFMKV